jgi:prolyl-tRNA editing enzyme YbaK/EbsC (Cys-tRNA(Pro) deacylase)
MIPPKVKSILDANGLEALEFEPGSTPTVETAAARIGVAPGQIAKSLLFKGKSGKAVMVVCAGDKRIPSRKLKEKFGEKMSMTDSDETFAITGFRPGGVCPFGLEGVPVYIDRSLAEWDTVYPAAGNDATGVPVTYEKLLAITGGNVCDISESPEKAAE